jgi:hypothetical protein
MKKLNLAAVTYIIAAFSIASVTALSPVVNVTAQANVTDTNATAAQEPASQFSANLKGESAFPPVATNATGSANFTLLGDGNTMSYKIDADKIDNVTDVFVAASSGGRFADLVQLRSSVDDGVSGPISGVLVAGNFTPSDFTGRLQVNQMSDLVKLILDGNAYIRVQTTDVPLGLIVGKITPNLPS